MYVSSTFTLPSLLLIVSWQLSPLCFPVCVCSAIAKKYSAYPVLKKRALFKEVADQIFEASPNAQMQVEVGKEGESRDREMANLAATEPSLDLLVEAKQITVHYANVASATVNFCMWPSLAVVVCGVSERANWLRLCVGF